MEIRPSSSIREQAGSPLTSPPVPGKSHLSERFTPSSDSDNAWRNQAEQLNQLAQMARLRGYR